MKKNKQRVFKMKRPITALPKEMATYITLFGMLISGTWYIAHLDYKVNALTENVAKLENKVDQIYNRLVQDPINVH